MIATFLMNLFLALVYVLLVGKGGTLTYLTGFGIGYLVLWIYGMATGSPVYGKRLLRMTRFGIWFMYILIKANLQIAWEIITPGFSQTPRILRYPVSGLTDVEVTTLANCITLTPGTLVVDISEDGRWLYIHCMYAQDANAAVAEIDELSDHLLREVFAR